MKKVFFSIILASIFLGLSFQSVRASSGDSVSGWAWSPNIGWISLNCTTGSATGGDICAQSGYGVDFKNNTWSGHAWNPHVGWISFNASDTAVCRPGSDAPFARVLSAAADGEIDPTSYSDSFDGCISLKQVTKGALVSHSGIEKIKSRIARILDIPTFFTPKKAYAAGCNAVNGAAWGSHIVGWISFSQARICDTGDGVNDFIIQANPDKVVGNSTLGVTLSYQALPLGSTFNACIASATDENGSNANISNWNGSVSHPSGTATNISVLVPSVSGAITATPRLAGKYTLRCNLSGGQHVEHSASVYRWSGAIVDSCIANPTAPGCPGHTNTGTGKGKYQEN